MMIPSVPNSKLIQDSGHVSDGWRVFFTQMVNELQGNASNEGYILPQQDQTNMNTLSNSDSTGALLYNSDTEGPFVNAGGVNKNMTTLEQLTTAQISAIDSGKRDGRFFHDTTTGELKIGFNNTIKTVTTT